MKWYTCTPVAFKGDHTFFCRDSGAFCKAFQELGIESKAIMPKPDREGDWADDLIRTDYKNLEDPEWWKSLGIDGLILYAWGMGKYAPIAKAIRQAGIFLVVYMDTSGLYYPWQHWWSITKDIFFKEIFMYGKIKGVIRSILRILKQHTINLPDYGRKKHWLQADTLAFPLPIALKSVQDREWLYGSDIVSKLALIANPVSSNCRYLGEKRNTIIAVGRWDDVLYKRPELLMKTLELAIPKIPHYEVEVYGNIPDSIHQWHANLPESVKTAIHLKGYIVNTELQKKYSTAKISICTSRSEGTHIASAEAICAGASVISTKRIPHLYCLQYYASHQSGTISEEDTPEGLAQALIDEVRAWEEGRRDPVEISNYWCKQLHVTNSCKRIIAAYEEKKRANAPN